MVEKRPVWKHFLICPVEECSVKMAVQYNASESECGEMISRFKSHLRSHEPTGLVDAIVTLLIELEDLGGE